MLRWPILVRIGGSGEGFLWRTGICKDLHGAGLSAAVLTVARMPRVSFAKLALISIYWIPTYERRHQRIRPFIDCDLAHPSFTGWRRPARLRDHAGGRTA